MAGLKMTAIPAVEARIDEEHAEDDGDHRDRLGTGVGQDDAAISKFRAAPAPRGIRKEEATRG